jgi:hypothetical protein
MAMSSERDYPNSGILFKEDRPQGNSPRDYKGTGDIDCPHCGGRFQFWISSWIKQGKKGKFMSLSFKAKDEEQHEQRGNGATNDEDIPF